MRPDSRILDSHVLITSELVVALLIAWKPSRILRSFEMRDWREAILEGMSWAWWWGGGGARQFELRSGGYARVVKVRRTAMVESGVG